MPDRAAATRYARALEGALEGDASVERAAEELSALAAIFAADPETAASLASPALGLDKKRALLETLAKALHLSPPISRLLDLLAQQARLPLLPEIAVAMGEVRDRRAGIVPAEVTTAVPMNGELAARTAAVLERVTGRKIRMTQRTDPALLGGMVAKVGSVVYDASVRTRLETMRSQLERG